MNTPPGSSSPPGEVTAKHAVPTMEDIFAEVKRQGTERRESDAAARSLLNALVASNGDVKLRLIALEHDGRDRHKLVVDELGKINGRLDKVEGRVTAVERNNFPTAPLWTIAVILTLGLALSYFR